MPTLNPSYMGEMTADHWENQLVIAFGDTRIDPAIPPESVWRIPVPSQLQAEEMQQYLQPERMLGGLSFVLPEHLSAQDAVVVNELQKLLIYLHYKFVVFPKRSLSTVDSIGVREEPLPDVVREINQLRNYPWLLSAPLTDKLAAERVGMPVFLVLPGPSSQDIYPHLKEISKRCLVACLGRTINECMAAGVEPDIVIQLDTYQVQRHFYDELPSMPNTLLVPLSICPFYPYANKFRGVVMMDSFNLDLLPNPSRLRESYVSSITACLGLAEVLHAPHAFISGANLSSPSRLEAHPYKGDNQGPPPIVAVQDNYYLNARNGELVEALEYFIATAKEVDQMAEAIAQTSGTQFYSTTDTTLLSPQWFPHIDLNAIMDLPHVNREAFLETVDRVLTVKESVDLMKTRMAVLKMFKQLSMIEQMYHGDNSASEMKENHQITKAVRKMRNPVVTESVDAVGVAARLATRWRRSLNDSRLLLQAMTNAGRGKQVPMLCFEDEVQDLSDTMQRLIPKERWEYISIVTAPYPHLPSGRSLHPNAVLPWLAEQQVVCASPKMMRYFDYILEYAPEDNVYDLGNVIGK